MGHIRANIEQQAERNAELRDGYQERLAAALAEFESRQAQHARVRTFAEWAAAQAPTVDTLSAEDRREILIHSLHPTIFIANTKSDEPRVAILFAVSAEAAAHIDPYELYTTSQWQNAKGEYYTSFVEELPTGGAEDDEEAVRRGVRLQRDIQSTSRPILRVSLASWTGTRLWQGSHDYEMGRRLLLGELNAAIEGALEAGATSFVVNDSHSSMRNLPPDLIHGPRRGCSPASTSRST